MCAFVFLVTTIFDIIVLFPVYITGKPREEDDLNRFQKIGMNNIMGTAYKLWFPFALIIMTTLYAYYQLYLFWD